MHVKGRDCHVDTLIKFIVIDSTICTECNQCHVSNNTVPTPITTSWVETDFDDIAEDVLCQ